jgi:hypothetical protein
MLEGIEGEVSLAGGVGVAVDGDYAAFFVESVAGGDREQGTGIRGQGESKCRSFDSLRSLRMTSALGSPRMTVLG